ncbi:hypothetical protein EON67_09210 [archaeon]|nr:MAG: hypothetical protein EON67_09210 [archaeon]
MCVCVSMRWVQGMAFGTGSAIAHRAVGAVAGAFSSDDKAAPAAPVEAAAPAAAYPASRGVDCSPFQRDFVRCLQEVRHGVTCTRGARARAQLSPPSTCSRTRAALHACTWSRACRTRMTLPAASCTWTASRSARMMRS